MHDFNKCLADNLSCPEFSLAHKTVTSGLPVMGKHTDSQTDKQTDRQTNTRQMVTIYFK